MDLTLLFLSFWRFGELIVGWSKVEMKFDVAMLSPSTHREVGDKQ